ncbi:ABC transporter ATP-binding protein [Novosphingobium sp.]|uniref:ABC transporter ATP-binding protein n=1 Tax=Novosphingobium sp. TaxID=1874826 RepID=UPI003B5203B7
MIVLEDIVKVYHTRLGGHRVLDGVSMTIEPNEKAGVLGPNGAGKSTLVRIISGAEQPTSGTVVRNMSVSWPLGFVGGFHSSLTGYDNIKFISRVYGRKAQALLPYIREFSELGHYLFEPVKSYSAGMRARLAFAISMAIDFDCLIIDEVIAVGDQRFQEKSRDELLNRRRDKAMVIITHEMHFIRENCSVVYVVDHGHLRKFDDVDEGIAFHEASFRPQV